MSRHYERFAKLAHLEVALIFCALLCAIFYGTNFHAFELAPGYVALGLAGLLGGGRAFVSPPVGGVARTRWLLLPLLAFTYFSLRAWFSPVRELGEADLFLVLSLAVFVLLGCRRDFQLALRLWLPWIAVAVLLIQLSFCLPQFLGVFPESGRPRGLVGTFGHRMVFGDTVALCTLILAAHTFLFGKSRTAQLIWAGGLTLGLVLVGMSLARGPIIECLIGLAVIIGVRLSIWMKRRGVSLTVIVLSLFGGAVATAAATVFAVLKVLSIRRGGEAQNLQTIGNSRTGMSELAMRIEPDNPFIGSGARSFSYEVNRVWDSNVLRGSFADPYLVHNEYIEALVGYGFIGLLSLILVLVFLIVTLASRALKSREPSPYLWCGVATLIGFSLHIFANFTLHLQSSVFLLGLILAAAIPQQLRSVPLPLQRWTLPALILGSSGILLVKNAERVPCVQQAREVRRTPTASFTEDSVPLLEKLAEVGNLSLDSRRLGNVLFRLSEEENLAEKERTERTVQAISAFQRSVQLHPFMPSGWINLGRLQARTQQYALARSSFVEARTVAKGREPIYPALDYAGENEYRWALSSYEAGFLQEACRHFKNAELLLRASLRRGRGFDHIGTIAKPLLKRTQQLALATEAAWHTAEGRRTWAERNPEVALAHFIAARNAWREVTDQIVKEIDPNWSQMKTGVEEAIDLLERTRVVPAESIATPPGEDVSELFLLVK